MVFYLKYRPQKIKELDSSLLRQKLEDVLLGKLPDKIPHAFLFTGPRGLGKTSTARILAKAINCTKRGDKEIEPCNKCDSCKSISNGSSLDVLELDGASNRGIDEIRDLREKIRLSPLNSKKKVYIIDEVHMLTTEAFNALLKTLEEPPEHVVFILCTTEHQKVPATITSRCFHIKFGRATNEDLISSFQRILKGEGIKAEKETLKEIAILSDGSFRDGAKILEELSLVSKNLDKDLIEKKYKTKTINSSINELIESFRKRDAKVGIQIVSSLSKEGVDFKLFVEELINKLHEDLILKLNNEGEGLSVKEIKDLIEMLVKAHVSIKYAVLPQLPLELTIVEWSSSGDGGPAFAEAPAGKQKTEADKQSLGRLGRLGLQNKSNISAGENDKILKDLIEKIKSENFSIAGVLRGCKVEKSNGRQLILSTGFKFHRERLTDVKTIDLIEKLLLQITGKKIKFSVISK